MSSPLLSNIPSGHIQPSMGEASTSCTGSGSMQDAGVSITNGRYCMFPGQPAVNMGEHFLSYKRNRLTDVKYLLLF